MASITEQTAKKVWVANPIIRYNAGLAPHKSLIYGNSLSSMVNYGARLLAQNMVTVRNWVLFSVHKCILDLVKEFSRNSMVDLAINICPD